MSSDRASRISQIEQQIIQIARELLIERGSPEVSQRVAPGSAFEDDLGLGSFDLVELLIRCETTFGVKLPDHIAEQAGTPAEWARVIARHAETESGEPNSREIATRRDAPPPPADAQSLIDVLLRRAEVEPDRLHVSFPQARPRRQFTFLELLEEAGRFAAALAEEGLRPGDTVGLLFHTSPGFCPAFFGVLLAGGVPLILHPPSARRATAYYVREQSQALVAAQARLLLAESAFETLARLMRRHAPAVEEVLLPAELLRSHHRLARPVAAHSEIAFLAVTGGTEEAPRPIALTHAEVLASLRALADPLALAPNDVMVSSLPFASVFGLVNAWLFSLYYALPLTVVDPDGLERQPDTWLWTIHHAGATIGIATEWAYRWSAARIPASALEGIDLSRWRAAISVGEGNRFESLTDFASRFAGFGFRAEAFAPAWGLAETAGICLLGPPGRTPAVDWVSLEHLETTGEAVPAPESDAEPLQLVSSGVPLRGIEVAFVDIGGKPVGERTLGRVFCRRILEGFNTFPWIDSGDIGYLASGEVYLVGRLSEVIFIQGRHLISGELERTLAETPGVWRGRLAIFPSPGGARAPVTVMAETSGRRQADIDRVREELARRLATACPGLSAQIELVRRNHLPRTPDGRIRRQRARDLMAKGRLGEGGVGEGLAVSQVWAEGAGRSLVRWARRLGRALGHAYRWTLVGAVPFTGGVLIRVLGDRRLAHRILRVSCRLLLRLSGQPVPSTGRFALRHPEPQVFVANRAGRFDPVLLAAALPADVTFVESGAIEDLPPPVRFLLRPLVLVPESNGQPSVDARKAIIEEALGDGCSVVVFPETAAGAPAIGSRFRLDAFQAAVEARALITPIGLRNTAILLEAPQARRRIGSMSMSLGETLAAADGQDCVELRRKTRQAIGSFDAAGADFP